jgi:putative endonuclease
VIQESQFVIPGLVPGTHRAAGSHGEGIAEMHTYFTYLLASKPYGTLYIGVINGLIRRIEEHRAGEASKFTSKYNEHLLVWYQEFADIREAIQREKTMKEWPRQWKINLIDRDNPHWGDLYHSLPGVRPIDPL